MTKNDIAWNELFDKYKILKTISDKGVFYISANQIKEFREPRLMTKFDHKSQLPKLFANNNLSILPTSRGGYKIGTFEVFCSLKNNKIKPIPISFPSFLESIDHQNITSEATALNCAFVSKILNHFTEEQELFPTISGRMSSSTFSYQINSKTGLYNAKIKNAQIEIDGGYEGDNSLILIEAKNHISKDFLVRQVYFPTKLWSEKVNKKIRPVFMTYSNGIFHLREYKFENINHYNSLHLVKENKYVFKEEEFNTQVLINIIRNTKVIKEPKIPFPQANDFERIINLCELIEQNGVMTKEQYLLDYDFGKIDPRQHDYYTNAARYLGLVEKTKTDEVYYKLTKLGEKIMNESLFKRQKEFIKQIISHSVFKKVLIQFLDAGEMPSNNEIVKVMKESNLYNMNKPSTFKRRASTIRGWLNWIVEQLNE